MHLPQRVAAAVDERLLVHLRRLRRERARAELAPVVPRLEADERVRLAQVREVLGRQLLQPALLLDLLRGLLPRVLLHGERAAQPLF